MLYSKKIIVPFVLAPLSFVATANEAIDLRQSDIYSLPDCNETSEYVLRSDVAFECVDNSYAEHMKMQRQDVNPNHHYLALNNKATTLTLNNKGCYVARFEVEYDWRDKATGNYYRH